MVKLQEVMASLFIGSVLSLINKTALLTVNHTFINPKYHITHLLLHTKKLTKTVIFFSY